MTEQIYNCLNRIFPQALQYLVCSKDRQLKRVNKWQIYLEYSIFLDRNDPYLAEMYGNNQPIYKSKNKSQSKGFR